MDPVETVSFGQGLDFPAHAETLRIVSWNINRGLQLAGIVEFLREASADLILLQEADSNARRTRYRNIAREIAQALGINYVFGREFEELTQGNHSSPAYHGQATLTKLPIVSSRILRFRRQSGFWRPRWFIPKFQKLQRRLGGRMALVTQMTWSKRPLIVYNLHLESRGSDALRCSQLAEILDDTNALLPDTPVIAAGDFNFDLSERDAASMLAKVSGAEVPFENPFHNGHLRATTTRPRLGRARAIDGILVRGQVQWIAPTLHQGVIASDHFPLSLVLKRN